MTRGPVKNKEDSHNCNDRVGEGEKKVLYKERSGLVLARPPVSLKKRGPSHFLNTRQKKKISWKNLRKGWGRRGTGGGTGHLSN